MSEEKKIDSWSSKRRPVPYVVLFVGCSLLIGMGAYFSPHIAMWRLSSAIEARDTQAVMGYVDLPRFRESLRSEMKRVMQAELERNLDTSNPFSMLGAKIVEGAADYLVESILTEESIVKILEGRKPGGLGKDRADGPIESIFGKSTPDESASSGSGDGSTADETNRSTEIIRDSFGTFRLVLNEDSSPLFELLWEGNGFTDWKLVGMRIVPSGIE